ncbi:MAG: hypothetical protein H6Q89_3307 [Myxococcaceae bacterium]|nr:hypothetical protein [Myxococcaceae bacterium]
MGRVWLSTWFALALLCAGCPYAIPGLRGDFGGSVGVVNGKVKPAAHVLAGVSLASVKKEPGYPFDVGGGYLLYFPNDLGAVHGGYLDGAWLHRLSRGWLLSVGPRLELLLQERSKGLHGGVGLAVRVGFEALTFTEDGFADGSGDSSGLVFLIGQTHGNLGIGLSAEVAVRRLPGQLYAVQAALSVTFRLPASAGLILIIPFPK